MQSKQEQELQMFIQQMHQHSKHLTTAEILQAVMENRPLGEPQISYSKIQAQSPYDQSDGSSKSQLPRTVPLQVVTCTAVESKQLTHVTGVVSTGSSTVVTTPDTQRGVVNSTAVPSVDSLSLASHASLFRPVSPGTSLRRTNSLRDQTREQVREDIFAEMSSEVGLRRKQSADAAAILSGMGSMRIVHGSESDDILSRQQVVSDCSVLVHLQEIRRGPPSDRRV